jgi:hypothetical protein
MLAVGLIAVGLIAAGLIAGGLLATRRLVDWRGLRRWGLGRGAGPFVAIIPAPRDGDGERGAYDQR